MENSGSRFDEFDNIMSGEGYEQDDSRMAEEQSISSKEHDAGHKKRRAEKALMPIAHKRKVAKKSEDSGYEQDVSSAMAVLGDGYADLQGKISRGEEETQVLPYSMGSYIDHSLDIDDDRPFAPIHRRPNFPESLFAILCNPNLSRIIGWLPHGRSFVILNRDEFAEQVLPVYFRHSNLSSFNRQLNGYGFNKIKIGPFEKSYYHPFFLRNLPHLVKSIKRSKEDKVLDEQSILKESWWERVSVERPLPKKMNPIYENQIKAMNSRTYRGIGLIGESQQPQAPMAAFAAQNEAGGHPVPSVIYTPSPRPLPQVISTPALLRQQLQSSPSTGSTERQHSYGPVCPQGTVFTQSQLPFAGMASNQAPQNLLFPFQTQPLLPFQQHPTSTQTNAATESGQTNATQTAQAQAAAIANEARQLARIQLMANALAAATGHGQGFQNLPLPVLGAPQLISNPSWSTIPANQSSQQQDVNANGNLAQLSPTLQSNCLQQQQQNNFSGVNTHGHSTNGPHQQGQDNVQSLSVAGASQLMMNPTQTGPNPQLDGLQQLQQSGMSVNSPTQLSTSQQQNTYTGELGALDTSNQQGHNVQSFPTILDASQLIMNPSSLNASHPSTQSSLASPQIGLQQHLPGNVPPQTSQNSQRIMNMLQQQLRQHQQINPFSGGTIERQGNGSFPDKANGQQTREM